jgi:hypothetical protein
MVVVVVVVVVVEEIIKGHIFCGKSQLDLKIKVRSRGRY